MARTTWSAEQDAELCRLWPNKSASEIGRLLGKTRNAIIGRFSRLEGRYSDYISPSLQTTQAERQKRRKDRLRKEAQTIARMKRSLERGLSRNEAIAQARPAARLEIIGNVFGITRERVRQISASHAAE